jgi:hypothetical protein
MWVQNIVYGPPVVGLTFDKRYYILNTVKQSWLCLVDLELERAYLKTGQKLYDDISVKFGKICQDA